MKAASYPQNITYINLLLKGFTPRAPLLKSKGQAWLLPLIIGFLKFHHKTAS